MTLGHVCVMSAATVSLWWLRMGKKCSQHLLSNDDWTCVTKVRVSYCHLPTLWTMKKFTCIISTFACRLMRLQMWVPATTGAFGGSGAWSCTAPPESAYSFLSVCHCLSHVFTPGTQNPSTQVLNSPQTRHNLRHSVLPRDLWPSYWVCISEGSTKDDGYPRADGNCTSLPSALRYFYPQQSCRWKPSRPQYRHF